MLGYCGVTAGLTYPSSISKPEPIKYLQIFTPSSGTTSDSENMEDKDGKYNFNMVALMEARGT